MEIPQEILDQVDEKGGYEGLLCTLPDDDAIGDLCTIHSALSKEIRLKILLILANQPLCVFIIKEIFKIPDSKLSYHLSVLKDCGLIEGTREGKCIIYEVTPLGKKVEECMRDLYK